MNDDVSTKDLQRFENAVQAHNRGIPPDVRAAIDEYRKSKIAKLTMQIVMMAGLAFGAIFLTIVIIKIATN